MKYDWFPLGRALIVEGYGPPLYPKIEFDAKKCREIIRDLGANVIRFPPIGYYAYYQTNYFPMHPDLNGRDLLQEMIDAVKGDHVKVVPYIPIGHPTLLSVISRKHPDWMARDSSGRPFTTMIHMGYERLVGLCLNSPYREAIRNVVNEIVANYEIDGIYIDGVYQTPCQCCYCKTKFMEEYGLELPKFDRCEGLFVPKLDYNSPLARLYHRWLIELIREVFSTIRNDVKRLKDIPIIFNYGDAGGRRARRNLLQYADGLLFEMPRDFLDRMRWATLGRSTGKMTWQYVGTYGHAYGVLSPPCFWLSIPYDRQELALEGYLTIASGATPLVYSLNRYYYEEGGRSFAKEIFTFMKKNAHVLRDLRLKKFIALPFSQRTTDWYPKCSGEFGFDECMRGFFKLLIHCHYQVEAVWEDAILTNYDELRKYKILCLSNFACMSDEEAEVVKRFVRDGGGLLATYETSLYDEDGHRREDFALKDLFHVSFYGEKKPTLRTVETYIRILKEHPITKGLSVGRRLPQDGNYIVVRELEGSSVLADTYLMHKHSSLGPCVVASRYGRGRIVYISSAIERLYYYLHFPELRKLIQNAVKWISGGVIPFEVDAPSGVITILAEKDDAYLMHLINYTGDILERPHCRLEYIAPVRNISIKINVPKNRSVSSIFRLTNNEKIKYKKDNATIKFNISELGKYEGVLINFSTSSH